MKSLLLLPALCLLTASPAWGQSKLSPSLRQQLASQPTARTAATPQVLPVFIHVSHSGMADSLRSLGVRVGTCTHSWLTAYVPSHSLPAVAALQGVRYVQGAQPVRAQLDVARVAAHVDDVQQGTNLPQGYTGRGVVVGVVDAGFDYTHPAFRSTEGLRIARVWEQAYTQGTPPEGYAYGGELVGDDALRTAMGDVADNSHGTHVAAIAAGSNCGNGWQGAAPDAELALVSKGAVTTDNVNITDAVAYLFRYAEAQHKPCVVNLSLGTQMGPHDGTSAFDQTADALVGSGRVLVGSAGNFGAAPLHVATTDGTPLRAMWNYITAPSTVKTGGQVDVWGTPGQSFTLQVAVVKCSTGEVVDCSKAYEVNSAEGGDFTYSPTKSASGSVSITTEVNPLNGKPHALLTSAITSVRFNYAIALLITPATAEGRIDAWADDVYLTFATDVPEGFTPGNTERTLAEIGGTGKQIISVGAYTSRNVYTPLGSQQERTDEVMGQIASFSATGPAMDGRMKPDVSAPGTYIISALNSHDTQASVYPLAGILDEGDGQVYKWGYMQGTSMAAPLVAGIVATWLEADPTLTPDALRNVLDHCCSMPAEAGATADAAHWGRGAVNAYDGLRYLVQQQGIARVHTASPRFVVSRTQGALRVLFTDGAPHTAVTLYDLSGRPMCHVVPTAGQHEVTLPTHHLPAGTYTLRVDGESLKCLVR